MPGGSRSIAYQSGCIPPMTPLAGGWRRTTPVRLSLAFRLGHEIDGAWWLRTGYVAGELADLVAVLGPRLGQIIDISVNWSSSQRPPELNWLDWHRKPQHIMTIKGRDRGANLLIVPYTTSSAMATMVLRQAAGLPVDPAHRDTLPFRTAEAILCTARLQRAPDAPSRPRTLCTSAQK